MKPAQWIGIVLAGAAMVFVITFALNYVGGTSKPTADPVGGASDALQLAFPVTQAPSGEALALGSEVHKPDWYDFWYRNENDRPVRVGLHTKNCKCSSVELYLLAPDWQNRLPAGWAPALGLALGAGPAVAAKQALAANRLAEELKPVLMGPPDMAQGEVPPGGQGWVRLKWSGDRPGPQQINATLWTDNPDGPTVILNARVMYHPPAQASTAVAAGTVNVRKLEQTGAATVNILCWSATRPTFRLEAKPDTLRGGKAASDPFVVGAPVLLNAAGMAKLEKQEGEMPGSVRCAWRVPVTLRAVSADGHTPFELGQFQRWVVLSSPDEGIEPMRVLVSGRVVGDVTAAGDDDAGRVLFGNFPHKDGTPWRRVSLESDTPGMELKLEEERLPKYLEARLRPPESSASGGHRTWHLEVKVKKGAARGPFPRQEDPAYADSAVYVQVVGKTPRSLRIPVSGTANDG